MPLSPNAEKSESKTENELLAKVSPKDTPINFSSKDGCLKRSYGGGGDCCINVHGCSSSRLGV